MKKIFWVIVIAIIIFGAYSYFKTDSVKISNGVTKTYTSADQLTDADKSDVADAIIEGEKIISSGNYSEMRRLIKITKPEINVDALPDNSLKILAGLNSGGTVTNKEQILASSTKWTANQNVVYVSIEKSPGQYTMLTAKNVNGIWYHN